MNRRTRKRLLLVTAGVVGLGALVGAGVLVRNIQRERLAARSHERGMAAWEARDYAGTVKEMSYYVQRHREDVEALLIVAEAHTHVPQENGRHILRAISHARAAAEADPRDPKPLEMLVRLYLQNGFIAEALDAADKLLALDARHRAALEARTVALDLSGKSAEALETAQRIVEAYPADAGGYRLQFVLQQRTGVPPEEMRRTIDDAVAAHPESLGLALVQIEALATLQDSPKAAEAAVRAAGLTIRTRDELARLLRDMDLVQLLPGLTVEQSRAIAGLAKETLDRRLADPDASEDALVLAVRRAWMLQPRAEDARQYAQRATAEPASAGDDALGWAQFLDVMNAERGPQFDARAAELAKRTTPAARAWSATLSAIEHARAQRWPEARAALTQATRDDPENPVALLYLGRAEAALGEWREAIKRWALLADAEPRWLEPRYSALNVLLENRQLDDALRAAENAMAADPTNTGSALMLAEVFVRLAEAERLNTADHERSRTLLAQLNEAITNRGEPRALLARYEAALGRPDEARRLINELIAAAPPIGSNALLALAQTSQRVGLDVRDQLLALAEREGGSDPAVILARALDAAQAGRVDEGKVLLREAGARASGTEAVVLERLLAVYLDRVRDPEALDRLVEHAARHPDDPVAQTTLLSSAAAWKDRGAVDAALDRLKRLAGEDSATWRLFAVRRFLAFDPSPANAATNVELLDSVLRREPRNAQALVLMADLMLLSNESDPRPAIDYLTRALEADPTQVNIYARLIPMLQRMGDSASAETLIRRFLAAKDLPVELRRARAALAANLGLWDEAIQELEALAQKGERRDQLALARVYAQRGQPDKAAALFDTLLSAAEPEAGTIIIAADFFASRGDLERGLKLLDRLPASLTDFQKASSRARLLSAHGRADQAEQILVAQAERPGQAPAVAELARFYLSARRFEEARRVLQKGFADYPNDPALAGMSGLLKVISGEDIADSAVAGIAGALAAPDAAPVVSELMLALQSLDRSPDNLAPFIAELRRITERERTFYPAWQFLVLAHLRAGDPTEAVRVARSMVETFRTDPRPAQLATEVMVGSNQLADATAMAREWRDRSLADPTDAEFALAEIELRQGRAPEAVRWLDGARDRVVARADTQPERLTRLASLLAAAGQIDRSIDLLWDRASRDREWAITLAHVGAKSVADPAARRQWLRRVESILATDPEGRLQMGQAWYDGALGDEDLRHLIELLEPLLTDPGAQTNTRGGAQLLLAEAHSRLGDKARSAELYTAAGESLPDQPIALNNLAYVLVDLDRIPEAVRAAERAVQVAREIKEPAETIASFLDTLGDVHNAAGRPDQAEKAYREALAITPEDATLAEQIVLALVDQGKVEKAVAELPALTTSRTGFVTAMRAAGALELRQKRREAEALYRVALGFDADHPTALNNLAYVILLNSGPSEEALRLSERAVMVGRQRAMPPAHLAGFLETRGSILLAAERPDEAETAYRDGLQQAPTQVDLLVGLAEALIAQGKQSDLPPVVSRLSQAVAGRTDLDPALGARVQKVLETAPPANPGGG